MTVKNEYAPQVGFPLIFCVFPFPLVWLLFAFHAFLSLTLPFYSYTGILLPENAPPETHWKDLQERGRTPRCGKHIQSGFSWRPRCWWAINLWLEKQWSQSPIALSMKGEKIRIRKLIDLQFVLTNSHNFARIAVMFNIKGPIIFVLDIWWKEPYLNKTGNPLDNMVRTEAQVKLEEWDLVSLCHQLSLPDGKSKGVPGIYKLPRVVFFVKALITPPLPSCLPNRVCFCPKMVCFFIFLFLVSQDLLATSRLHYMCVV